MKMQDEIDHLAAACRQRGVPVTQQRLVVWETLRSRRDHPTADEIYGQVRDRLPRVSRATVYRIATTFVRWGLAQKVPCGRRGMRFDGFAARHHHFVCNRCDRVCDVDVRGLKVPSPRASGFRIQDYTVVFSGLCPACCGKEAS